MERITKAAIKYFLKSDPDTPRFAYGLNHGYCIEWFGCAEIYVKDRITEKEQQGFLTNNDRFVDRLEAYQIAKKADQLKSENENQVLFSENINYFGFLSGRKTK